MADFDSEFGGRKPGTFEFSDYLRKLGGDEFFSELTDYQGRRSATGPRAGYNYRTKKPRDEQSAAEIQALLDALYEHWGSRGWTPMDPPPVAGKTHVVGDPLLDEANRLAGKE